MKISYRPISTADFAFLKKVYRSTRNHELELMRGTEEQKSHFIEFQFNAQHAHYTSTYNNADFNIVILNTDKIGRLYIGKTNDEIRIIDISLLPEYRGKGIGTMLLNDLINESEKTGKKLALHVEPNNPALRLYKRLGFELSEDKEAYIFMERMPKKKL